MIMVSEKYFLKKVINFINNYLISLAGMFYNGLDKTRFYGFCVLLGAVFMFFLFCPKINSNGKDYSR